MQGPCEKGEKVKLWTILAWYLYSLYKIGNVGHQRLLKSVDLCNTNVRV